MHMDVSQQMKSPTAARQPVGNCLSSGATVVGLADVSASVLRKDEGPSSKHELTAQQSKKRAASAAAEGQARGAAQQPETAQLESAALPAVLQQSQGVARQNAAAEHQGAVLGAPLRQVPGTVKQAAPPGQAELPRQIDLKPLPDSGPPPVPQADSALAGQAGTQGAQQPQERSSEAGSQKTRVAVAIKEESGRASPKWKVRGTREAEAQHTGNTLFAEASQPGEHLGPTALHPAVLWAARGSCPDSLLLPLH